MEKDKVNNQNKKGFIFLLILGVIFFLGWSWIIDKPSEEELCDNAIDEAKFLLSDSDYDLNDWMIYQYRLNNEEVTSITIMDSNCDIQEKNDIDVTLDLDVTTSKNRLAHIEAVVPVIDGYAEDIEFNQALRALRPRLTNNDNIKS